MGCAPSIHLSQIRIIYCDRKGSEDDTSTPRSSVSANHLTPASIAVADDVGGGTAETRMEANQLTDRRKPSVRWTALLVFPRRDSSCTAWENACKSKGYETTMVTSQEQAIAHSASCLPNLALVVADARCPRTISATAVAKAVAAQFPAVTVLAVVKRNLVEKHSKTLEALLDNGIDRVWVESNSTSTALAELSQLERSEMKEVLRQQAIQTVFTAMDNCREAIHITDHNNKIQFINKSCESLLGHSLQDVMGKSIWDVHGSDVFRNELRLMDQQSLVGGSVRRQESVRISGKFYDRVVEVRESPENNEERRESKVTMDISEAINSQLRKGKDWEGVLFCRRKSGDLLQLPSKVTPIATWRTNSSTSTNSTLGTGLTSGDFIVYTSSAHMTSSMGHIERQSDLYSTYHSRGSVKSRNHSYDIRSLNSEADLCLHEQEDILRPIQSAPADRDKFSFSRCTVGGTQPSVRRQSIAKLHTVTLEAPITRVISIIAAAQENSPAYVSQALEKVLEILRSKELYLPQMVSESLKPVPADPVATDLLGGLLAHSPAPLTQSGRRSSNDTSGTKSHRPNFSTLGNSSAGDIAHLLTSDNTWGFDVIKLEELSEKRPLVWLGLSLMCQLNVPATLNCDEQTLQNWLTLIEANYHSDNSYHNSTHAADVLHATAYFLQRQRIAQLLDPLDVACSLIAAIVHDVDHPGKNSAFLCNTSNQLAILYNDTSVLESHHSALSFKLTSQDNRVNIYKGLPRETYKEARKIVVDMVLATDMTKHFEHVSKFVNMLDKCSMTRDETAVYETVGETMNVAMLSTQENQQILKRMLIKCADVSNPLRPWSQCVEWAQRIANEYFSQTEEEKKKGLPIVMPQFDRTTCSIPKSQIGFIDFFISDMFEAWDTLADIPDCMTLLRSNYHYWQDLEKRGSSVSSRSPSTSVIHEDAGVEDSLSVGVKGRGSLTPVD